MSKCLIIKIIYICQYKLSDFGDEYYILHRLFFHKYYDLNIM